MKVLLVVLCVWWAAAGEAWAQGWSGGQSRTYPFKIGTPLMDHRSPVVSVPATLGFYTGMVAGLGPGLLMGLPLALADQAVKGETSQFSANVLSAPSVYTGVAMHYAAGGPAYVGKLVFWDIPSRLLGPLVRPERSVARR